MSPSEFDLRAALRDGEGAALDVDRIIAGGQARQARRRAQLLTASLAVVFLGAAGTAGAFLLGGNGAPGPSADGALASRAASSANAEQPGNLAPAPKASDSPSRTDGAPPSSAGGGVSNSAIPCPASFPTLLLPGGGGSGQFGAAGPLFTKPARSIVVCSYGSPLATGPNGGRPGRLVLTGSDAVQLQASLESAPTSRSNTTCPQVRANARHALAFIGVDPTGRPGRVITTTLTDPPCDVTVTNGTAVRYDWTPTAGLGQQLLTLRPAAAPTASLPSHSPSGKNYSSPVR